MCYFNYCVLGLYILHQLQKFPSWKGQVDGDGCWQGTKRSKVLLSVSCNLFLLFSSTVSVIGLTSCCHQPKKTEDLHLHRWRRSLGRVAREKGGSHVVITSLRSVKILKKYIFFYLGLRCCLPYCEWVSGQIKLYAAWHYKWVSDGFVLPEEMNWLTERLLLTAQQMSNIAASLGEGEG